ncbi:MAG TPA: CHAT domain-containing protein, partial [Streptomyces sp.]|uniref:CHAT domain-containing protein n=1 Tax=Streptomyces sp. TaxID=1931 RepID=UPI002C628CE6
MNAPAISVTVSPSGSVTARTWQTPAAKTSSQKVDLGGLDGRVLRVFERWLMEYERRWNREDIRVFGQLLHRRLFSGPLWSWVEERLAQRGPNLVRLQLSFPTDAASSRLAALPWEYLCAPDRQGGQDGEFLVLTPGLMLSRSVPPGTPQRAPLSADRVRVLVVVGEAQTDWLGEVDYQPVLDVLEGSGLQPAFDVLEPVVEVTRTELAERVRAEDGRPHVLHYIGHGRFDRDSGKGSIALHGEDGGPDWVDEDALADVVCTDTWAPTVVVLHACEGGSTDYEYRYAGLAPTLVRRGVQCVVAMQYPVTNETANDFSGSLYDALAAGQYLD